MQAVQKIFANPTTDGIILILSDGKVIPHLFHLWGSPGYLSPIKTHFAGEVDGSVNLADYDPVEYSDFSHEVEHADAVLVYTREAGWLI